MAIYIIPYMTRMLENSKDDTRKPLMGSVCFSTSWTVCSLSGSSVHGILQPRILQWVAFPSPGDLPDPSLGDLPCPSLKDLPNPWIKLGSPALQTDSL